MRLLSARATDEHLITFFSTRSQESLNRAPLFRTKAKNPMPFIKHVPLALGEGLEGPVPKGLLRNRPCRAAESLIGDTIVPLPIKSGGQNVSIITTSERDSLTS